jgi:hypothetical protein
MSQEQPTNDAALAVLRAARKCLADEFDALVAFDDEQQLVARKLEREHRQDTAAIEGAPFLERQRIWLRYAERQIVAEQFRAEDQIRKAEVNKLFNQIRAIDFAIETLNEPNAANVRH